MTISQIYLTIEATPTPLHTQDFPSPPWEPLSPWFMLLISRRIVSQSAKPLSYTPCWHTENMTQKSLQIYGSSLTSSPLRYSHKLQRVQKRQAQHRRLHIHPQVGIQFFILFWQPTDWTLMIKDFILPGSERPIRDKETFWVRIFSLNWSSPIHLLKWQVILTWKFTRENISVECNIKKHINKPQSFSIKLAF